MKTHIKKQTLKSFLNMLFRRTQRTEITKLQTSTVTVRNVYKNKQIIDVSCNILNRCYSRI